jgi:membrane protein required for colicin V production
MFVDALLLLIFIIVAGVGFFQGTIKLFIAIITFYASIVLASLYFKFLSSFLSRRGTSPVVSDAISFFLIITVCFIILLAAGLYTFRYVRMPGRLEYLDRILGVVLGILLGVILSSIVAMVLQFLFITNNAGNPYPISRALQASTRSSNLLRVLIFNILPQLFNTVAPFLPDAALPFFSPGRR